MSESRIAPPLGILIAHADSGFKKAAAAALAEKGFSVAISETADEAFEKVRAGGRDVILYDLDLPGYDGLEAVTLVAKMRAAKESYIIATSGRKDADIAKHAIDAGAWEFAPAPVTVDFLNEIAQAIKRHLRRPKDLPEKAVNHSLRVVTRKCPREGCGALVAGFVLRGSPMVTDTDQFETVLYVKARQGFELVDYSVLSVTVCPECYFAFDQTAAVWRKKQSQSLTVPSRTAAAESELFRIAAAADDTLFGEDRSPQSALVAFHLAAASALRGARKGSADDLAAVADILFRGAAVAHGAGEERARDRFFAEAEEVCREIAALEPCAQVYRAVYRLVALYIYFARDADAAAAAKSFEKFTQPGEGRMRPRDSRLLSQYRLSAAKIMSHRDRYRRARYLAG